MNYEEATPISRTDAVDVFTTGEPIQICRALVRVVFHDPDWRWVQEQCIRLAARPDPDVRGLVATCFGHLARLHGELDAEKVVLVLRSLNDDPEITGRVEDALDDIRMFLGLDLSLESFLALPKKGPEPPDQTSGTH